MACPASRRSPRRVGLGAESRSGPAAIHVSEEIESLGMVMMWRARKLPHGGAGSATQRKTDGPDVLLVVRNVAKRSEHGSSPNAT